MHSDPENRMSRRQGRSKSYWGWVATAAIIIVGVYFLSSEKTPTPEVELTKAPLVHTPTPPPEPELPAAPDIPQQAEPEPVVVNEAPAQSPATLETSDQELRDSLATPNSSVLLNTTLANEMTITNFQENFTSVDIKSGAPV
jgi:hypothetical protein